MLNAPGGHSCWTLKRYTVDEFLKSPTPVMIPSIYEPFHHVGYHILPYLLEQKLPTWSLLSLTTLIQHLKSAPCAIIVLHIYASMRHMHIQ